MRSWAEHKAQRLRKKYLIFSVFIFKMVEINKILPILERITRVSYTFKNSYKFTFILFVCVCARERVSVHARV